MVGSPSAATVGLVYGNKSLQVLVCGGDNAHIRPAGCILANTFKLALLE
jgi:hypothetical protein